MSGQPITYTWVNGDPFCQRWTLGRFTGTVARVHNRMFTATLDLSGATATGRTRRDAIIRVISRALTVGKHQHRGEQEEGTP